MTIQRTPYEQQKYEMIRILRSTIRLWHSIEADREINEVLPKAELAFDAAVQKGELPETIDLDALIKDVTGG